MKVCILTSAHPPFDARIFYKEACSLQKAGYEVVLIAPGPETPQMTKEISQREKIVRQEEVSHTESGLPREKEFPGQEMSRREEVIQGVRVRYVPPFQGRVQRVLNLKNIYRAALEEKADIYHFHDPDLIFLGLRLQAKLHKPVIYDVHEYYADSLLTRYWLPAPLRKVTASVFAKVEKAAARRFAGIITVNDHMKGLFRKVNPVGESLFNFPLAGQFVFPRPSADEERWRSNPHILYLGGINRERGLEIILEAMALVREKHPQAVCDLVGPVNLAGISERYLPLEKWLAKGNIRMRGKIPYSEVPAILKESNIALVPLLPTLNYQKAIPVKLIEYMAAGLPVVGSRFGHIENIIRDEDCGRLAEPADPRSLADEICYLLEHPDQALKYAQNGWDAFHSKYTWESEEGKLLKLYSQILSTATNRS